VSWSRVPSILAASDQKSRLRACCVKFVISKVQTLTLGLCILRHNIEKPDSLAQDVYYASVSGMGGVHASRPIPRLLIFGCDPSRPNSLIFPVLQTSTCATSLTFEPPYTGDSVLGASSLHKMAGFPTSLEWVLLFKSSSSSRAQGYRITNADRALENWAAW
jgi:hypothetical protein